ncbi:hypothetical protein [Haloferula sp. A504]|uniref:hypothetical protein n=1 Tax=Haloferula sp. A504 TaxID=3373601 RepID=UPI0031BBFA7D|nr:hypothetical protein [Verrucomicrobiaceae bacterium E54]
MKWLLLIAPTLTLVSCIGLKATKHTYAGPARGSELGGAEVRVAFRPEGSRPGSFMVSAMVVGGGMATLDGPFKWRVEALGEAGRHESFTVHRIRTRTLKTGRDEWFPAGELGAVAEFRPLKDKPGVVRARYPIPGLLKVKPEEDGGLEVWVDASVAGPGGRARKMLRFRMQATEEDASEVVFLPVEIAESIGTDPADWEDPMWD